MSVGDDVQVCACRMNKKKSRIDLGAYDGLWRWTAESSYSGSARNCRSVSMQFYSDWGSIPCTARFVETSMQPEGSFLRAKTFLDGSNCYVSECRRRLRRSSSEQRRFAVIDRKSTRLNSSHLG